MRRNVDRLKYPLTGQVYMLMSELRRNREWLKRRLDLHRGRQCFYFGVMCSSNSRGFRTNLPIQCMVKFKSSLLFTVRVKKEVSSLIEALHLRFMASKNKEVILVQRKLELFSRSMTPMNFRSNPPPLHMLS